MLAGDADQAEEAAGEAAERGPARLRGRDPQGRWPQRGRQPNLSFFAFTATPKYKTLEVFGVPAPTASRSPSTSTACGRRSRRASSSTCSQNYTTYKTYYRLIKAIEDDPEVEKTQGGAGAGPLHEPAPAQHRPEDRGDGRALPRATRGTRSAGGPRRWWSPARRLHAVRYKQAFDKYIAEKGYTDIKTLVAFSRRGRSTPTCPA